MHEDEYGLTQSTLIENVVRYTRRARKLDVEKTRSLRKEVFVFFTLYIPHHVLHIEDTKLHPPRL